MFAGHYPHIVTLESLRRKAARRLAQEADRSENVDRDVEEPVMKDGSGARGGVHDPSQGVPEMGVPPSYGLFWNRL